MRRCHPRPDRRNGGPAVSTPIPTEEIEHMKAELELRVAPLLRKLARLEWMLAARRAEQARAQRMGECDK